MTDKSPNLIDGKYSFIDLVDLVRLRGMFEAFSSATGLSVGISTYPAQEPLIRTGWQDICTRFHRAIPESNIQCVRSNLELTAPLEEQKSINIDRCRCGLIDGATPVIIRGVHVADLFTGQVLFEKPDIERFRNQAEEYGYDEAEYLEALGKVPVTDEESFRKMLQFLNEIAVLLAEQGLVEMVSRGEAEKAMTGEENVRAILDSIGDGVIATDALGIITRLNPVAEGLTGWKLDEAEGRPLEEVFRIVSALTGKPAENPADRVLKGGGVVGLANHTALIARDGTKYQIADSAAPILGADGSITGVVLVFRNVTEEYRMLAALKESEETFRSIIESSPMGMFIYELDEDDRLVFVGANPAADRLLGVDNSVFIGMTIEEAFPPLADTEIPDRYRRAARLGESWMTEHISYDHDGISGAFQVHAFRMSPGKMAVMFFDITERKRADERLRSERIFTDTVIQSLPGLFYIIEEDTARLIRWNTNWNLIAGYTDEEMRRSSALDFVEDKELIASRMQRVYDHGSSSAETCLLTKDGRRIPYYFSGERVVIEDKTYLAGLGIDISERWKALESLRESEERFRDLVDLLPEAVFETDKDIRLTFANRRAYALFGYSGEDIERGLTGLELIAPEDRERARSNIMRRLQGEKIGAIDYSALKKDGSTCPVLLHTNVITKEGKIHGLRGIIMDMTESKRVLDEKARLEMQYHRAQKVESIGRLAGGVSHDLNNLLSPIIGYSELLREQFGQDDARRESIDEILRAAFSARDLVQQLLAFSRKQTLEYRPVDMNSVVIGFKSLLQRTIPEDIEIAVNISDKDCTVLADIGQIEQVLMNLAINAADSMPGGGRLTIETSPEQLDEELTSAREDMEPGRYVMLAVTDTGHGINEEISEHLFEPFFSTKGEEGTGLGLATVYGIVKQHGGHIWVYSESDIGTTFKVYLPSAATGDLEKASAKEKPVDYKGTETILLVEDDEQVRKLTLTLLERQGYRVLIAKNGPDAISLVESEKEPLHLLLTDVIMPGMNGRELFKRIEAIRPEMKVLYMSGYSDEVIAHRGILDDDVQFIQKPFSTQVLSSRIREILE